MTKKKLTEVALPLEAINVASLLKKSIYHAANVRGNSWTFSSILEV